MRSLARAVAAVVAHDWYRIYATGEAGASASSSDDLVLRPVHDLADIEEATDPAIRTLVEYAGHQAVAFGAWRKEALVAVAWVWWGERYATRDSWPLVAGEAKLVQITVAPSARGQGIAPRLIAYAASQTLARGFSRVYARVWHSHRTSIHAFEKAGWRHVAGFLQFRIRGFRRRFRVIWRYPTTTLRQR
jgi:GNAT superfamily N-acetyltransferase